MQVSSLSFFVKIVIIRNCCFQQKVFNCLGNLCPCLVLTEIIVTHCVQLRGFKISCQFSNGCTWTRDKVLVPNLQRHLGTYVPLRDEDQTDKKKRKCDLGITTTSLQTSGACNTIQMDCFCVSPWSVGARWTDFDGWASAMWCAIREQSYAEEDGEPSCPAEEFQSFLQLQKGCLCCITGMDSNG